MSDKQTRAWAMAQLPQDDLIELTIGLQDASDGCLKNNAEWAERWRQDQDIIRSLRSELQEEKGLVDQISEHESGCIGRFPGREQQCRCIVRDARQRIQERKL